jgi:hypothetical protein
LIPDTTGVGKHIGVTYFHVSSGAYFVNEKWLRLGMDLFLPSRTDQAFLLPLSGKDLQTLTDQRPECYENCLCTRRLLSTTKGLQVSWALLAGPGEEEVGVYKEIKLNDDPILAEGRQCARSVQSGCTPLATGASGNDCPKEDRDMLGRWRPEQSEEQVRTSKAVTMKIQDRVAEAARLGPEVDTSHWKELLQDRESYLLESGVRQEALPDQIRWLSSYKVWDAVKPGSPSRDSMPASPPYEVPEVMEDAPVAMGTRTVSAKGTLHRVGKCYRAPGAHFKGHLVLLEDGTLEEVPPRCVRVCKDCFPRGRLAAREPSSSEEEED